MSESVALSPFFERAKGSLDGFPADAYVAGLREAGGTKIAVEIAVPSELVEVAVLTDSRLNISLSPNGRLTLYAEGVSDVGMEAASRAVRQQTLESLIQDCLDPDLLAGEDDAVGDLSILRAQLVRALAQLVGTLEQLRRQ
jgi:hypothetical protein